MYKYIIHIYAEAKTVSDRQEEVVPVQMMMCEPAPKERAGTQSMYLLYFVQQALALLVQKSKRRGRWRVTPPSRRRSARAGTEITSHFTCFTSTKVRMQKAGVRARAEGSGARAPS